MRSYPVIPYTAAEQVDALNRMAPELVTKRNQLHDPEAAKALIAIARNLQRVAAEEGVPLRIVEACPSLPMPNPLAMPLAKERYERQVLQWNVSRGILLTFILLATVTVRALSHGDLLIALVTGTLTLAGVPLFVLSYQAECREVR